MVSAVKPHEEEDKEITLHNKLLNKFELMQYWEKEYDTQIRRADFLTEHLESKKGPVRMRKDSSSSLEDSDHEFDEPEIMGGDDQSESKGAHKCLCDEDRAVLEKEVRKRAVRRIDEMLAKKSYEELSADLK